MNNLIKSPLAITLVFLAGIGLAALSTNKNFYTLHTGNDYLQELLDKFNAASKDFPEDRVYLHVDKPFYKPGESIWFKAYMRNGSDMKASVKSDILHVELINPKGSIEKEIKIVAKKGLANGDFFLDESCPGGLYKIKAYTNWQKNENTAPIFEKEIQVQAVVLPKLKMKLDFDRKAFGAGDEVSATTHLNTLENKPLSNQAFKFIVNLDGKKFLEEKGITTAEGNAYIKFNLPADLKTNDGLVNILIDHEGNTESISRSIPIVLNNIEFSLFPEGGDLVAGLETKVAFKALNEFGKPADVEGYVVNSKDEKVADFKSFHQGMGAFAFKPLKNEKYKVKISQPKNIKQTFDLPETMERGYVLNVNEIKKNEIILNIASSENEEMAVVAQVRNKIYYSGKMQVNYGNNKLSIPIEKFPIGVTQITLFDSKGIERAERLAFINKDKQLKVKIETDKEKYLPREKVKLTLKVTDERDIPMPADFSLAVVDDKLLSFADDRSGNILSKMYLEYDIKEKVEEPSFYFDPSEKKADEALDYLLMTSGWRRFTWEQITDNTLPAISFQGEKAIVSGTITDSYTGKVISKAKVEVVNKTISTETDEKGHFTLTNVDLSENIQIKVSANGYSQQQLSLVEYNANMNIGLYDNDYYKKRTYYYNYDGGGMKKKARMAIPQMAPNAVGKNDVERGMVDEEPEMMIENIQVVAAEQKQVKMKGAKNEIAKDADDLKVNKEVEEVEVAVEDKRAMAWAGDSVKVMHGKKPIILTSQYYRARQFAAPVYDNEEPVEVRTDFRSTIYWNGNVVTDRTGKAVIEFYNSDEISSFRITAEGISADGMIGRMEKTYFTQLPFSMSVKAPVETTFGDMVSMPLTLKNNTDKIISGNLNIVAPEGFEAVKSISENQTVPANQSKTLYLDYKVLDKAGKGNLQVAFKSAGLRDAFEQEIKIAPKGFPASISFSGKDMEKEYTINISNVVDGSMNASFTAYPSVVSDLMKGVESIIREPYGCFEQTSTSNYPNILVKKYIIEMGQGGQSGSKKIPMPSDLDSKLDKGYKRLVSYETKEKGYEWFGGAPAHEALTAYGLMQFNDMKDVYSDVDNSMIDRTANWLMSRKDGNGGFQRSGRALDQFGRASEDITNAYIVYGLSEAGYRDIQKEADKAYEKAMSSKDPYQLALVANTMFNLKDKTRGNKAMKDLNNLQEQDGSWNGLTHSITYSQGKSLIIETTSLAILASIKSENPGHSLNKGVEYIVSSRDGYGGFGSTQGTVLALKALTEYAKYSKKTDEDGSVEIFIDGHKVASKDYKAGETNPITVSELEKYFKDGKHTVKVKYHGVKNPLPFSMAINYNTFLPNSSKQCKVNLKTDLKASVVNVGETVRLTSTITNNTEEGLPMTMAIIGIPAGMSPQPWQLKEMQEKLMFDFYEIRGNNVFVYYRQMKPGEKREINLDLKAEIPGDYEAPASSGYLYYTNEFKSWSKPEKILIKK